MMSRQWSSALKGQIQEALDALSFASRDGKVWLKHLNGKFGYINSGDAVRAHYAIHTPGGDALATPGSASELLDAGWVLDKIRVEISRGVV